MEYELKLGALALRINNVISEIIIFDINYKELERKCPVRILNFDYDEYGDVIVEDFSIQTNKKNDDVILKIFTKDRI